MSKQFFFCLDDKRMQSMRTKWNKNGKNCLKKEANEACGDSKM